MMHTNMLTGLVRHRVEVGRQYRYDANIDMMLASVTTGPTVLIAL